MKIASPNNVKSRSILLLCIVLLATLIFSSIQQETQAKPSQSSSEPRCDLPGIVRNRSSRTIVILGDLESDPGAGEQVRTLHPGQDSTVTTMGDVDYIRYDHAPWIMDYTNYRHYLLARQKSNYIFNTTWRCTDRTDLPNSVICTFQNYNWGPQG